jgi:hypothetical protein
MPNRLLAEPVPHKREQQAEHGAEGEGDADEQCRSSGRERGNRYVQLPPCPG